MDSHDDFWREWFGLFGRELGPPRWYTDNPDEFLMFIRRCAETRRPCFMSVQPYRSYDTPFGLEKLYFDFDSKTEPSDLALAFQDVLALVTRLKGELSVESLIVATYRGFHVYVFLWHVVEFRTEHEMIAKGVYQRLQEKLLSDYPYETLDTHCVGDIKRLARVPYTLHEKGVVCRPVDLNRKPITLENLDLYRERGVQERLFKEVVQEVREKLDADEALKVFDSFKVGPQIQFGKHGLRPCFVEALKSGNMPHEMRMALVHEAHANDMSRDEILDLFEKQSDFDRERCNYYVEKMLDSIAREGCHPYRCATILAKGWCLKEKCPRYGGFSKS